MAEVWFYHLKHQPLEAALPTLVAKARERGWKAVIRAGSSERVAVLDEVLWTYDDASFLAHGLATDPNPETQPVLLTTEDERPNGAEILFLVDRAPMPAEFSFTRVVVLFDSSDREAEDAARETWRVVKGQGHAVTYWVQDENGRWTKKA